MAQSFSSDNESRLRGALGSLEQAVACLKTVLAHGEECPRSASNVQDAEKLAKGAGTLLGYIFGKGDW